MMNRIGGVYLDMARSMAAAIPPPSEYLEVYGRVLDLIESRNPAAAASELDAYLERHDSKLVALLDRMK
jgi:hypothetical protein